MRKPKDEAEIKKIREQRPIAVTVHGHQAQELIIIHLEEIFKKDHANVTRVTVPNKDMLQHQRKAGFPLHVTSQDVLDEATKLFKNIFDPRMDKIKQNEANLECLLDTLDKGEESKEETTRNVCNLFKDIVDLGPCLLYTSDAADE